MEANRPGTGGSATGGDPGKPQPQDASTPPVPPKATANRPILITDAPINLDDDWDYRRKRYVVMMSLRALCVIGASATYRFSGVIAAGFVLAGLVLPWTAVVMANDRPPKQGVRFRGFHARHQPPAPTVGLGRVGVREIESGQQDKFDPSDPSDGGDHPVIDL